MGSSSSHDVTVSAHDVRSVHPPGLALTTPASGLRLRPLLKVEARVEEQLSSYRAVLPSLMAELMEMVHMLEA